MFLCDPCCHLPSTPPPVSRFVWFFHCTSTRCAARLRRTVGRIPRNGREIKELVRDGRWTLPDESSAWRPRLRSSLIPHVCSPRRAGEGCHARKTALPPFDRFNRFVGWVTLELDARCRASPEIEGARRSVRSKGYVQRAPTRLGGRLSAISTYLAAPGSITIPPPNHPAHGPRWDSGEWIAPETRG